MNVLAHIVTDTHVLWYPFVALSAPAVIVALLTRADRKAAAAQEADAQPR